MSSLIRILHLEDDSYDAELCWSLLREDGLDFEAFRVDTRDAFVEALDRGAYDLILADYSLPSFDGLAALALAVEREPQLPLILVSGTLGEDLAIEAMKAGATDYVLKHNLSRLPPAVRRALREVEVVAERRQAEHAARESEERYRLLFESSQAGLYRSTLDGRMLGCNQAFADCFGYSSPGEAMGGDERERYADLEDRRRLIEELQRNGQVGAWELPMRRRDGEQTWVVLSAHLVADEAGNRTVIEGSLIDVTDRKRLQDQLTQAQKMEAVGLLAGGMAHDFNNILQTIILHLQFVSDGLPPGDSLHADLESARAAAEKAAALTRQLLAFGRRQVLQAEDLDLNEVVSGLLQMIRRVIGEDLELIFLSGRGLGTVHADPGQVEQVLMNLCLNARDAMPSGGRLTVETENVMINGEFVRLHPWAQKGRYVLLSVADTGCGMDQEALSHAFDPFFTTKGADRGTGLGLASVFGIVKQHDGMIHIYSEVDKGTMVKVYLPIVERRAAAVSRRVQGPVAGGSETLLLAEDDETVRFSVARVLEMAGYTVIAARDGSEAVQMFEAHASGVEMVILDVVMPGLSGAEACERIREIDPGVRVLFSSGYSANAIHTSFVLDRGKHLIQKPYDSSTLLRKVREVLDGGCAKA